MSKQPRLGAIQRDIARALRDGATLTKESGIWHLSDTSGSRPARSVSSASCRRMYARGLLMLDKAEDHPGYLGGRCEWYALTEVGKRALAGG